MSGLAMDPLRVTAGLALCMAAAALVGWFAPLAPQAVVQARTSVSTPVFVHPGAVLAEAALRLGVAAPAIMDAAVEEADTSVDVTPPPPRIDAADLFRMELSAVIVEGEERVAVLIGADGAPRRLRQGAAWRDGWRVADVNASEVVIRRRGESRRIAVMGSLPAQVSVADAPVQRRVLTRAEARKGGR